MLASKPLENDLLFFNWNHTNTSADKINEHSNTNQYDDYFPIIA